MTFLQVRALSDADFRVCHGETVALVGDNGAGKPALVEIQAGADHPDGGQIAAAGQELHLHDPHDANALGIAVVFEDLALVSHHDVAGNLSLRPVPARSPVLDKHTMVRESRKVLQRPRIGIPSSLGLRVGRIPRRKHRQAVPVARTVQHGGRWIVVDESRPYVAR